VNCTGYDVQKVQADQVSRNCAVVQIQFLSTKELFFRQDFTKAKKGSKNDQKRVKN
jgi:hypothetical protein